MIKAKIWNIMDKYLLSNTLCCREGSKWQLKCEKWVSEPNYRGVKITSERLQHHNVGFTQRLVDLLVKCVEFSNLCCIMCQWWPFKNGKGALFKFFNSKSIKDIYMLFWMLGLWVSNISFGFFVFIQSDHDLVFNYWKPNCCINQTENQTVV